MREGFNLIRLTYFTFALLCCGEVILPCGLPLFTCMKIHDSLLPYYISSCTLLCENLIDGAALMDLFN